MSEFPIGLDAKLEYFKTRWLALNPPAPDEAIAKAERLLACSLSPQHKMFLRVHNGGRILETKIRGVQLLGTRRIQRHMDIVAQNLTNWSYEWWPRSWLELGTEGLGNYYVADLSRPDESGEYPILFVDHEAIGEEGASSTYADSYFEFLDRLVTGMIELYDPYGKLKPQP